MEDTIENGSSSFSTFSEVNDSSSNNNGEATSVVLQVAYDGLHFHGWTAANSDEEEKDDVEDNRPISYLGDTLVGTAATFGPRSTNPGLPQNLQLQQKPQPQRNKNIRTVQKTLVKALAKIYGNVPLERITVEGCSRTDRGVSAVQLVAHVYCQKNNTTTTTTATTQATTKTSNCSTSSVTTRPISPIDPNFQKLPFHGNLHQIIYVLNRMLPFDVRVLTAAYMPTYSSSSSVAAPSADTSTTFHPSLTAISKTYVYRLSLPHPGTIYDPLQWRHVWNIAPSSSSLHRHFDFQTAQQACDLFQGKLNLKAFQGALRGSDRTSVAVAARKANNTICNMTEVSIIKEGDQHAARKYHFMFDLHGISPPEFLSRRGLVVGNTAFQTTTYVIVLRGDRFLYKMCRFVVGIIVAAGYGKVSLESIHNALHTGSWEESSGLVVDSSTANNDTSSEKCHNPPGSNWTPKFECAPAHGLVLYNVEYPEALSPKWQE